MFVRLTHPLCCAALLLGLGTPAFSQIKVEIVKDEAEAVLSILALEATGKNTQEADWSRLFQSEGFTRLAAREKGFKIGMNEKNFKEFVQGKDLAQKAPSLASTLSAWCASDLAGCARKALAYLPEGASIQAKVYPVIKPRTNSFVFERNAVFLYLDPLMSKDAFENTVTHEFHHIGFGSLKPDPIQEAEIGKLSEPIQEAIDWVGSFGEGFAMLAAAGGPDIHPHAASSVQDRQRWDKDMARFDQDLHEVERFLLDIVEGRLQGEAEREKGRAFFGVQGPWYTVGWRMATTIEQQFGRPSLLTCMKDARKLLPTFNAAVAKGKLTCATWSPLLLARLSGTKE
jgi:hypothetical protein